jgi:hypothetical protein
MFGLSFKNKTNFKKIQQSHLVNKYVYKVQNITTDLFIGAKEVDMRKEPKHSKLQAFPNRLNALGVVSPRPTRSIWPDSRTKQYTQI